MGLDSQIQPPFTDDSTEPVRKATTASMQNLLAMHLEAERLATEGAPAPPSPARPAPSTLSVSESHFDAPARLHALSIVPGEQKLSAEESIAASFARLEAAFAAAEPVTQPEAAPEPATDPSTDWPVSAQALVESLMMENERLREQLHQQTLALQAAQDQADNDVLTPTLNRRAFLRDVQRAMADCKRYGEEACLIYLDMDSFKAINDAYGHGAGDAALVYVAETLKASVREGDAVGRMGGDEFAVLLRRADLKSSRIKAMKLEAELAMGTFEYKGLYLKTGGSFGVRAYAGQPTAEAWLSEADAAMFLAKKSAR
ncbi:MAG: GGDEF domain-containing protein [Asticcacaulis sp.]|nr:GGDEF domain-containing protein [Asticcacaulis sp.]